MARHYFIFIKWQGASTFKKVKMCIKKPIRAWWVFEINYMRIKDKIHRKKLFALSQGMMLLSIIFLKANGLSSLAWIYRIMGLLDFVAAVLLFTVSIATYPIEKYFIYKAHLRSKLVN